MTTIRCIHRAPNQSLFDINFQGNIFRTTVTADPRVVDAWFYDHVDGPIAIAVRHPAIMQIFCSDTGCLIFQINRSMRLGLPLSLRLVIEYDDYHPDPIVGISISKSLRRLQARYGLVLGPHRPTVEIRNMVIPLHGLQATGWPINLFASRVLGTGYRIPPAVERSRWSRRVLGNRQVMFASLEAYVTFTVYATLTGMGTLTRMGMADSDSTSDSETTSDSDSL